MLYRRPIGELLLRMRQGRFDNFLKSLDIFPVVQQKVRQEILKSISGSKMATAAGCRQTPRIEDFPVAEYESFRPWIERFASGEASAMFNAGAGFSTENCGFVTTSGTSGQPKILPVTPRAIQIQANGWQTWGLATFQQHHSAAFWDVLPIAPADRRSMGGLTAWKMQPGPFKALYAVPEQAQGIQPFSLKIKSLLRLTIANQNLGMIMTANPSTILMLVQLLERHGEALVRDLRDGTYFAESELPDDTPAGLRTKLRSKNKRAADGLDQLLSQNGTLAPAAIWPNLQLIAMWQGGTLGHYCEALKVPFGHVPWRDHGLVASEGRFTIPLKDNSSEGVLDPMAAWFEFLPVGGAEQGNPPEADHLLAGEDLIPGESYQLIVTTHSGLIRYNMHDIVECRGFKGRTPIVAFVRKSQQFANITGEKLSVTQVKAALDSLMTRERESQAEALADQSLTSGLFLTLAPEMRAEPPHYSLYVELPFGATPEARTMKYWHKIAAALDQKLGELNCEYQDKRASGRLAPVAATLMKHGALEALRAQHLEKARGATPEQFKQPLLWQDSTRPLRDMAFTV